MDKEELEMRFVSFITMMGTAAMQHLGKIADPFTGKIKRDLEAAKGTIDLLMVLKEKTKNNLTKNEENALNSILSNLQLNYVDESEKPAEEEQKEDSSGEGEQGSEKSDHEGVKEEEVKKAES